MWERALSKQTGKLWGRDHFSIGIERTTNLLSVKKYFCEKLEYSPSLILTYPSYLNYFPSIQDIEQ
jgi:hypothetical protein